MKLKDRILSDREINTSRQWDLDLARAVLIFCLALVHVAIECTSEEGLCYGIPYILDTVIGGPLGAPMFMFVMGVGMAYTHRSRASHHFERGVKMFLLAYALNICRFVIPYLVGYTITGDQEYYLEMLPYKLFGNDIFTFAGLAMMLMALFVRLKLSRPVMLLIATVMCALGTLLNGVDLGSPFANIFVGYIMGTEDAAGMVHSYFPLLNWMIFPVFGYSFAYVLKRVKNKDLFYLCTSLPALIIAVVYFILGIQNEVGMFGEGQNCYYHMIFPDVLASLCVTVAMIGVYYLILKFVPKKMLFVAWSMSENITAIYFVHWVLVSFVVNVWMYAARGTTLLSPGLVLALGTALEIASIIIAHFYTKWKGRYKVYEKAS